MKTHYLITGILLSALLSGCNVNRDISVPEHAHVSGTSTINGEISVGTGAVVDGSLRTINGRINVAAGAQTGNLTAINGSISLADSVHAGDLKTVNGNLSLGKNVLAANLATVNGGIYAGTGTHIAGNAVNVNGDMALCNAQVDGNLTFYNGSVFVTNGSVIHGAIMAKKPTHDYQENHDHPEPILIIGPHASVGDTITFERSGQLYVSDSATIHGVTGVTPVKYSGTTPTNVRLPFCPAN